MRLYDRKHDACFVCKLNPKKMKTRILLFCLTLLIACTPESHYCYNRFDLLPPEGFTTSKLSPFESEGDLYKIRFITKDIGYILAGVGSPNTSGTVILKTVDGGYSWDTLAVFGNTGSFKDILFLDENIGIITDYTSDYPVVKRTEDGGQSWTEFRYPELGEGRITRLHTDADQNLYASLASTWVVKSTDKGKTWQVFPFPRGRILALHQERLYLHDVPKKEIMVTDLNGNHIKNFLLPHFVGSGLEDFEVIDENNIIVDGYSNSSTAKTSDGGDTWRELFTDRVYAKVVSFNSAQEGIMIYETGYCGDGLESGATIGLTTDGGDSWKESEYFYRDVTSVKTTEKINEDQYIILVKNLWNLYELWLLER